VTLESTLLQMKKTRTLLNIFILISGLFLLNSCAKPEVVQIIVPGDENLNCEQLENEISETLNIKRKAEYARDGTGGNMTRAMLFWPAWAQTLHNADVAIRAADDRNYHLLKIMKKKKCNNISDIKDVIANTRTISGQLKDLKEMYDDGYLTKEEYGKAKKKLLD
tara:strand:- start:2037 stop:2531 length:495 start_codon:yes stop_codon:yes gene_type:complete